MERAYSPISPATAAANSSTVTNQRIIIAILTVILIFSLTGTQSLSIIYNIVVYIVDLISRILVYLTANIGYSTGSIIQTTANVGSNAAISTAQIADGTLDSIGSIFRDANSQNVNPKIKSEMDTLTEKSQNFLLLPPAKTGDVALGAGLYGRAATGGEDVAKLRRDLDEAINKINSLERSGASTARPDTSDSAVQRPITATKAGWCFAGTYQGKTGCVAVAAGDRCMSGKFFESRDMCMGGSSAPPAGTVAG